MPSKEAQAALEMLQGMLSLPQFAALADEYDLALTAKDGGRRAVAAKESRERRSWGSISWFAKDACRIRYPVWEAGVRKRRCKTIHGVGKREAEAELARLRARYDHPSDYVPCPTFAGAWDDWYHPELLRRYTEGEIAERTLKLYEQQWRTRIESRWGSTQLDALNVDAFQSWLREQTDANARLARITMMNIVKCAEAHGVTGLERVKALKGKTGKWEAGRDEDAGKVYTAEEVETLLANLRGSVLEVPAILMARGSCRVGEACGALLSDCREATYKERLYVVVDIDKQLTERHAQTAKPKTRDSVRPVVIAEPWSIRLKEIIDEKRAAGLVWLNDNGAGEPVYRSMVSHWWRKDVPAKGVRYLPMGKLRNSWATWMLWDLKIERWKVDKMMGHAGSDVLAQNYDKPVEEMYIEAVHDALFGKD